MAEVNQPSADVPEPTRWERAQRLMATGEMDVSDAVKHVLGMGMKALAEKHGLPVSSTIEGINRTRAATDKLLAALAVELGTTPEALRQHFPRRLGAVAA